MIDWNQVETLRQDVGEDTFEEVVDLFFQETDAVIARICGDNGSPRLAEDLHFLKGSALSVGFSNFAQLCQSGERSAIAGTLTRSDIQGISECYASSRAEFLAKLERRLAG